MKSHLRSLAALFFSAALPFSAFGADATPQETFAAFQESCVAKDVTKARAFLEGTEEEIGRLKNELENMPAEMVATVKAAKVVDSKIDGEAAIAVVEMMKKGAPEYSDWYFVLRDGKWKIVRTPDKIPADKAEALRTWARERRTALQPAPK